jgi:hypothetical protein
MKKFLCVYLHADSKTFDAVWQDQEQHYTDEGPYVLDTRESGNSKSGHDYGTPLSQEKKRDLIEYLKTL